MMQKWTKWDTITLRGAHQIVSDAEHQFVIDQLYKLVAAPSDYNRFMDFLEEHVDGLNAPSAPGMPGHKPLSDHLKNAAVLMDAVAPWQLEDVPFIDMQLSQTIQSGFAIDASGDVQACNLTAIQAYSLREQSSYRDLPFDDLPRFMDAVQQTISGTRKNTPNNVLRFAHRTSGRSILMTLEPFQDPGTGSILAIVKTSDIGWPHHLGPILQDLYNLTVSEIDVVKLMVEGVKPKDIAERRQISLATVRSQLSSIFAKTETDSQIDCIRLIFGLSLMHGRDDGAQLAAQIHSGFDTPFYPRDDQRQTITLPDGRTLDYADFGDPNGRAVLFNHCELTGDVLFRDAVLSAQECGLRFIAPLRPGYGQSTPHGGHANDPMACALDAQFLLDKLNVQTASILAVCCGFAPAIATSALMGDRIRGVTATRPYFPVESDTELNGFSGYTKLVQQVRLRFPQALNFVVKAGFAYTQRVGPVTFGKSLVRASPEDLDWFSRAEVKPFVTEAIKTHRDQGHLGTFSDLNYKRPWRHMLEDAPTHVRIIIGEHDRNVQWDESRKWADALPHVSMHVLKDAGYMVHHQQAKTIIKFLDEDLR